MTFTVKWADMNNAEVQEVISKENPLFYWMHLTDGEQYLIPFICQRCGGCCRLAAFDLEESCGHFEEPNICNIYDERPSYCRSFPVYNGSLLADTVCHGYQLCSEAMVILGRGVRYRIGLRDGDEFTPSAELEKVRDRLRESHLPEDFMDRFIELNS